MANFQGFPMPQVGIAPGQVGAWLDRQLPIHRGPQLWRPWEQQPAPVRGRGLRLPTRVVPYPRHARVLREVPVQRMLVIPPPPPVEEPMAAPVAPPLPPPPAAAAAEPEPQQNNQEPGQGPPSWMVGLLTPTVLSLLRLMVEGDILCALKVDYTRCAQQEIPNLSRFKDFEPSALLLAFVIAQVIGPESLLAIPRPSRRNREEESDSDEENDQEDNSDTE